MKSARQLVLISLGLLAACGGNTATPDGGAETPAGVDAGTQDAFECTNERANWEQCVDGKVQWCHIGVGDPHFHWGVDCQALGLGCYESSTSTAVCVDTSTSCAVGAFKCEGNTAYNCVEVDGQRHLSQRPCGTAALCEVDATTAHCEEKQDPSECGGHGHLHGGACECDPGYSAPADGGVTCAINPQAVCDLFTGTPHPVTPVTSFTEFPSAHVDLAEPVTLSLPASGYSFAHFPVSTDGEYVVFTSLVGAVNAVMSRDGGVAAALANGSPSGKCPAVIVEHFHAELAKDDAAAEKVPYILRLSGADQLAGDAGVRVMVMRK